LDRNANGGFVAITLCAIEMSESDIERRLDGPGGSRGIRNERAESCGRDLDRARGGNLGVTERICCHCRMSFLGSTNEPAAACEETARAGSPSAWRTSGSRTGR